MIVEGFIRKSVELPGECIGLDLTIPGVGIELAEPLTKGSKLFTGEYESRFRSSRLCPFRGPPLASNDRKYSSEKCRSRHANFQKPRFDLRIAYTSPGKNCFGILQTIV